MNIDLLTDWLIDREPATDFASHLSSLYCFSVYYIWRTLGN